MIKKLQQQKAETLVETLVALLIATLSVMLLTSAITASARINSVNKEADQSFAKDLMKVETYNNDENDMLETHLIFKYKDGYTESVPVELYGGTTGQFASYKTVEDEVEP